MSDNRVQEVVQINKYPNRRYYDIGNSRHITLQEIHDLVLSGKDVCVTDTKTGEDLTNAVLMQILLERDHVKLDLFPSSIMHMMIRSNRKALRGIFDRFFSPFLSFMAAGQKQFDSYLRETMKRQMISPLDWTDGMLRAFGADGVPQPGRAAREKPPKARSQAAPEPDESSEIDNLRSQIDSLRRKVSDMSPARRPKSRKRR